MPLHWAVVQGRGMLLASLAALEGGTALRRQAHVGFQVRDAWQDASGRCARQLAGRLDLCTQLQLWSLEVRRAW